MKRADTLVDMEEPPLETRYHPQHTYMHIHIIHNLRSRAHTTRQLTIELDFLLLGLDEDNHVSLELDHLPGGLALDRVHFLRGVHPDGPAREIHQHI